jgi:hypothetical protein
MTWRRRLEGGSCVLWAHGLGRPGCRDTGSQARGDKPTTFARRLPEEMRLALQVLATEYNMLMAALGAAWSASLTRTSLFLGVLSAAGVAFGFASQGGMKASTFLALALLVLVLVCFWASPRSFGWSRCSVSRWSTSPA